MKLKAFTDKGVIAGYTFWCPGCQRRHQVTTAWTFNGDRERPTFTPSLLVRTGHYLKEPPAVGNCYCDFHERYPDEEPMPWTCLRCHSFIRDGMIQFLGDCTHALANQTVPLPDIPALGTGD